MFRSKYTLAEIARMLKRSETSIVRDIESGYFVLSSEPVGRRRGGGNKNYEITVHDLKGYLGEKGALAILDPATVKEEAAPVAKRTTELGSVKRCRACGRFRPIDDYGRDYKEPDGLHPLCKECRLNQRWR